MHKLIKKIEDKANASGGEIGVLDVTLAFISETDGQIKAEYTAKEGTIKKEEKEWTILFVTDGELHAFPIEYAYEVEEEDGTVVLHFDYEDDAYVTVKFRF